MFEDLERDTCNFLVLFLESLTGASEGIRVVPLARGNSTIFQIELDSALLQQLLVNDSRMLHSIQVLIITRGMRHHRDFRIGFDGRITDMLGDALTVSRTARDTMRDT